jgi:DNA-binding Xre family transcriptional regulator
MRTVTMQWNLRQVMADRAIFATSELVPLLGERDIHLSREHVYRLVTKTPQRLNTDVLVALCDILACTPNDLITPVVEEARRAKTGTADGKAKIGSLRPVRTTIRRPKGAR